MRPSILAYFVSVLAVAVLIAVLLVANIALSACYNFGAAAAARGRVGSGPGGAVLAGPLVHVCFCGESTDLRPLVVAVRSVLAAASAPEHIVFHYITLPEDAARFRELARLHLPGIRIHAHPGSDVQTPMQGLANAERRGTPLKLVPFYLDEYLTAGGVNAERIVYFDVDVVVQGDVKELATFQLGDAVCGVVMQCGQRFEDVVDFEQLTELGLGTMYDRRSCVAGHGVLVVDTARWRQQQVAAHIGHLMNRTSVQGRKPLWQTVGPDTLWSLALEGAARGHVELDREWECGGLAEQSMSPTDILDLKRDGLSDAGLAQLNISWDTEGNAQPRVSACSAKAKLLHFSGPAKPWDAAEGDVARPLAMCWAPRGLQEEAPNGARTVRLGRKTVAFTPCHALWSRYISDAALVGANDEDDEDLRESEAGTRPGEPEGEAQWVDSHEKFLDNLKRQVEVEQSRDTDAIKQNKLKKLLQRQRRKAHESDRNRVPGAFQVGQRVRSTLAIAVQGHVVVRKGTEGIVQGPSIKHPQERIQVLFKARTDGKSRAVNVLPREILLDEGEA